MLVVALIQQEHAARGPLDVEPGLMIWTVVVFVALLLILRKFAWPALLGAVEARERALEEQLAEADIAAERDRAVAALGGEAVDLSLAAASKLMGERLNSDNDRRIVQEYLT